MATKTERILGYLPPTFRALPRPTALFAVVDAAGRQLVEAENSLGAVMLSHWVDHADQGAQFITDLGCFSALYGLAPRGATKDVARFQMPTCVPVSADETVEQFREHLKRYVLTFLDGTVSVQGILRIVAEALGLHVADSYAEMDTWWTRGNDPFVSTEPRRDDAAGLLFGKSATLTARGTAAFSAGMTSVWAFPNQFDPSLPSALRIGVDGAEPITIDLALGKNATLRSVVNRINDAVSAPIATDAGGRLSLVSPTIGGRSRILVAECANDVSPFLLGLWPLTYMGAAPAAAEVTGNVPLTGELDLRSQRYLRLLIDGELAEVDCGGNRPANRSLPDVVAAINAAFKKPVAWAEGQFLKLRSVNRGSAARIEIQSPAAQDATELLFGSLESLIVFGRDAAPASISSVLPFDNVFDLSKYSTLRLALDDAPPIAVDCAGPVPSATDVSGIIDAVNRAFGGPIATLDEREDETSLMFRSITAGPSSRLRFVMDDKPDASSVLFGLTSRVFRGADATAARLVGSVDLSRGADLRSLHKLQIAIDDGSPVEIDFWPAASNLKSVSLPELCMAVNSSAGRDVATHDGTYLILKSPKPGPAGSLAVQTQKTVTRRFVTRAYITDDAATRVLGLTRFKAVGTNATPARLKGNVDLSKGVDLRTSRFLRIDVDLSGIHDIDCAARARIPRAATLAEIVDAINLNVGAPIASDDGRHLILTSPKAGFSSSIFLEATVMLDATAALLGDVPSSASGRSATGVQFTGTVDLSHGVDLRAHDRIKIGVDGAEPVEIHCAGPQPQLTTLDQIVHHINQVFPGSSLHDGTRVHLVSQSVGPKSQIEFATPAARDATAAIFGIGAPRVYRGTAPAKAVITGTLDLRHGVNLTTARFLCVSLNLKPAVEIDCGAGSKDPAHAQLREIIKAINDAAGVSIADSDGVHLTLSSPEKGIHERIALWPCNRGDARTNLFGQGPHEAVGKPARPATISGTVDLRHTVDLSEQSILRLAVDGGPPMDIDVAGAEPDRTSGQEIADKIAAAIGARPDAVRTLTLFSPTQGDQSTLELLPVRALELIDYPPASVLGLPVTLEEGKRFSVDNNGAAESALEFDLNAPQGESGMEFVEPRTGTRLRIMGDVVAGGKLAIKPCGSIGVVAEVTAADGTVKRLPDSSVLSGQIGAQARIPFAGEWPLSRPGGFDHRPALQLNDPVAHAIVLVRALNQLKDGEQITVQVTEAGEAVGGSRIISLETNYIRAIGRLRRSAPGYSLVDESETALLHLQTGPTPTISPDRLVAISGAIQAGNGWPRTVIPELVTALFDVHVRYTGPAGRSTVETYSGVTIGLGNTPLSLQVRILERPSQLILAREVSKAEPLRFPRGSLDLTYMNCHEARFNRVVFGSESASSETPVGEVARFAGGQCREWAVFDISRFSDSRPDGEVALFGLGKPPDPAVKVETQWIRHQPGAFTVNLPADLDQQFGARFNEGRFGPAAGKPEQYEGVITEPDSDPDYIVKRINAKSTLVTAAAFTGSTPPPGFEAFTMPFLDPRSHTMSGGSAKEFARIYLAETGVPGLIELKARVKGDWGNRIAVTAKQAGTVRFDMTVGFEGLRFENAREIALAGRILAPREDPLSQVAARILKPSPVGVLQAKAAGIRAEVTRNRTAVPPAQDSCRPITTGKT